MVFQDPTDSLNPRFTAARAIADPIMPDKCAPTTAIGISSALPAGSEVSGGCAVLLAPTGSFVSA